MSNGEARDIATWIKPGKVNDFFFFYLKKFGTPKATLSSREVSSFLEVRDDMIIQESQKLGHAFKCLNVDPTFRHPCLKISGCVFIA